MAVQKTPFILEIPKFFEWTSLRRFLVDIKDILEAITFSRSRPDQVTNFTSVSSTFGVTLTWNPATNASAYRIYRSTNSTFTNAVVLTEVQGNDCNRFVDPSSGTFFYWIVGLNALGQEGPIQ